MMMMMTVKMVMMMIVMMSPGVPVDLLALLKWKSHPDRVMDVLARLRHVSGEEIVKVGAGTSSAFTRSHLAPHTCTCLCVCVCVRQFLQDILDTLFSILDDNTEKYGPLVFQSLVSVRHAGALQEPSDGSSSRNHLKVSQCFSYWG